MFVLCFQLLTLKRFAKFDWPQYPAASLRIALLLLAGSALSACDNTSKQINVITIGDPAAPFARNMPLPEAARTLRSITHEGLTGFDSEGRVVPALAERWIVVDDGQSYIFRLREDMWPDGKPVTAIDVRSALLAAITTARKSQLAVDLRAIDDISVKATRVLEIRLKAPHGNLLELLAQPELGLAYGGKPYGLMRMRRDGDVANLSATRRKGGQSGTAPALANALREVSFAALPAAEAIKRFDQGEADLVLNGRLWDFPLANRIRLTGGAVQIDPVAGLFGIAVASSGGFLSEVGNREAIAMAIDRGQLSGALGGGRWPPSTLIVPNGAEGLPADRPEQWAMLTPAERRRVASATVARWNKDRPGTVRLRLAMPSGTTAGPGADILAERLTADLAAIGVALTRVGPNDTAELRLVDQLATYPQATWYLRRLSCTAGQVICIKAIDAHLNAMDSAPDPAVRAAQLAEAEAALRDSHVFIALGAPFRWALVRSSLPGFASNRFGVHPLIEVARVPK